ncbi:MAG: AraC family transcriptional regulator [Pseudomonadota bacterium]
MLDWKSAFLLCLASAGLLTAGMAIVRAFEVRANLALFGLVFAWTLLATPLILGFSGAYDVAPWLTFAPFNTELWIGPLWLIHVKLLTQNQLSRWDWLWLLPGVAQSLYYTACFTLLASVEAKFTYSIAVHQPYIVPVETVFGLGLGAMVIVLSWRLIRRYKRWLPTRHGNSRLYDLAWLERSLYCVIALFGLWLVTDAWQAVFGGIGYYETFWLVGLAGVVLAYLAGDALSRSHLRFPKMDEAAPEMKTAEAFNEGRLTAIVDQIREEHLYEDADLSLAKLARAVGMSESSLSRIINSVEGRNFNTLINGIRVEAVCVRLNAGDDERQTLLQTALDAGFGSKATFNRAFKAEIGVTPREWLTSQQAMQKDEAEAVRL